MNYPHNTLSNDYSFLSSYVKVGIFHRSHFVVSVNHDCYSVNVSLLLVHGFSVSG